MRRRGASGVSSVGLSVIIITKNEAQNLPRALDSVSFADEVIVLDSGSTDGSQQIARCQGARLFEASEWPGFGPQKNLALEKASQEWVLSLDADEWLEPDLALEIKSIIAPSRGHVLNGQSTAAFRIRRRSIFIDRVIRFGDWRRDKVVRLFRRGMASFSEDMVHERLIVNGSTRDLRGFIGHFPVRSIGDAKAKMWRYNRLIALRISRDGQGGVIKGLLKAIFSIFRGLVLRAGFLDGLRGFQLAWFNAYGAYLRYSLAQNTRDRSAFNDPILLSRQKFLDTLQLFFVDHGFLRALYENRFRLAGGLYRVNQPSPNRLALYVRKYGIKTVINLRGANEQLGWYRLEEEACRSLGLILINVQVYSRGLVNAARLAELRHIIRSIELPAVVHCKSGADRAGFFSVLYRHYRLGEPIEHSLSELGLFYGHSKSAKTGVLDFFFQTYIKERGLRQAFDDWVKNQFNRDTLQAEYRPKSLANWFVDQLLRRE